MSSEVERLSVLETEVKELKEQIKNMNRNQWGLLTGLGMLMLKFFLDNFGIQQQTSTTVNAIIIDNLPLIDQILRFIMHVF